MHPEFKKNVKLEIFLQANIAYREFYAEMLLQSEYIILQFFFSGCSSRRQDLQWTSTDGPLQMQ